MGDDPYNQTHTANLINLELTQEIWARDPWILKWHKVHKKRDLHSIRPYTSKSHPASHLSPSPPCFQWGETRPRFHADLFVHIQHPTNGVPFLTSLLNGLAEEQPGKAGSGIGFCSAALPALGTSMGKNVFLQGQPWDRDKQSQHFILHLLQLPPSSCKSQRNHCTKAARGKAAVPQGFTVCSPSSPARCSSHVQQVLKQGKAWLTHYHSHQSSIRMATVCGKKETALIFQ